MSGILNLTLATFRPTGGGGAPVGVIASIRNSTNTISNPRIFIRSGQLVFTAGTFSSATGLFGYTLARIPLDLSTFTWQTLLTSSPNNTPIAVNGVSIDSANSIIVCGSIFISFNNLTFPYVAKYNSSGVLQWNRYLNQRGAWESVTTDSSNSIYATGGGPWAGTDRTSGIYVKYSADGATVNFQRAMDVPGSSANTFNYGVSILNSTQYVMGLSVGNAPTSAPFTPNVDYQTCLCVFSQTDGILASALQYGSTANIWQFGGFTVAGEATDTMYMVFTTYVTNTGSRGSMVLVKYTTAGATVWQRQFADASISVIGEALCMDSTNTHIYAVAGTFSGAVATGRNELLITKWDLSGNLVWQRSLVSPTASLTRPRIAVDSLDNFYLSFYSQPVGTSDRAVILKMPGSGAGSGNTATVEGVVYNYITPSRTASTSTLPVASFTRPTASYTHPNIANPSASATGVLATTTGPY
jgi:hypothetical protein